MKLIDRNLPFFKGNTHAHTRVSDGAVAPEECMRQYKEAGYDFLAITDHWKVGSRGDYHGMLVLPGVEYDFTFPSQVLHLVCLFEEAKDADGIVRGMNHMDVIERVNAAGGLVIAAHPAWSLNTPDFLSNLDGVGIAEVYNTVSGEPFNGPRANSEGILDVTAANGKLFNLAAADDSHYYRGEQCVAFTVVQAEELTAGAILAALRRGSFYASQGPEFRSLEWNGEELAIETSPVSRISVISNRCWVKDRCIEGEGLTERVYRVQPGETFLRVQITDANGKKAWSNPVPVA